MGSEEGSGWGTHVCLWRIHFDIWQNQYNIVNFKNKIKILKKESKKKKKETSLVGLFHLILLSEFRGRCGLLEEIR